MGNQGKTQFTLLAISKLYNTRINLVGVNENRQWIRPMPVYQSDLFSQGKSFEVFSVTEMVLNDWWVRHLGQKIDSLSGIHRFRHKR